MSGLTHALAHRIFDYDPATGRLFWKSLLPRDFYTQERTWNVANAMHAGKQACNVNKSTSYLQVVFQRRLYQVHRVIWLMHYGVWPAAQIDHLNRNRQDNRLSNLRSVTHAENMLNRSDNTSGHPNIHYQTHRPSRPWRVTVKANGVQLPQKTFVQLQDALAYRDSLRLQHQLPAV